MISCLSSLTLALCESSQGVEKQTCKGFGANLGFQFNPKNEVDVDETENCFVNHKFSLPDIDFSYSHVMITFYPHVG